jgi:hypothetical protein
MDSCGLWWSSIQRTSLRHFNSLVIGFRWYRPAKSLYLCRLLRRPLFGSKIGKVDLSHPHGAVPEDLGARVDTPSAPEVGSLRLSSAGGSAQFPFTAPRSQAYTVKSFGSAPEFLAAAPSSPAGCVTVDIRMPEMVIKKRRSALHSAGTRSNHGCAVSSWAASASKVASSP